jgi:DNA (cytosine-5)-methyltransferase 1
MTKKYPNVPLRVVELFAGVGGFRLGLEKSGWDTIFANQWEPGTKSQAAFDCYANNFLSGSLSNENISIVVENEVNGAEQIGDFELLVGGFPCQDYSVAKSLNSSKGLQGKKGVLWWDIHKLVELKKPKFIFLENVDRLLKSPAKQRGRDFAIMLKTLGDLGYLIEWRVVNAAEQGFPQRRIRVFIVATRIDQAVSYLSDSAENIISNSGILPRAFPVSAVENLTVISIEATPDELTRSFGVALKTSPFKNSGVFINGMAYTSKVTSVLATGPLSLGDVVLEPDLIPDQYWIPPSRVEEWRYLKGAKSIDRVHKETGTHFKYSEGKMAFPDLLENPARTIITGEGGTGPSRFKHVILQNGRYRRLTPVELERLNGFPDDWTKIGASGQQISDVKRAFFMGNALVVGLIERVGDVLAQEISRLGQRSS